MDDSQLIILTETEARSKNNQHRIAALESRMDVLQSLATSVAEMAVEQKHLTTEVRDLKGDIKAQSAKMAELEKSPSKRWEKVVDCAIAAVVAAIVAYILHGGTF